jgi:hypothetical protein
MSKESKASFLAGLDKALLLALATPFAYVLAFQYDRGYLNFFGVPDVLVDVSLRDLLVAVVTIVSVAYTLYLLLDGVLVILPERWPQRIKRRAIWLFWITIAFVLFGKIFDLPGSVFAGGVGIIALLFFFCVVIPLFRKRTASVDGENQPPRVDPYIHKGVVPALMRSGIDGRLIIAVMIAIAAGYVSQLTGEANAMMQTSFLVHQSDSGTTCAVIRMRDSDLLCADFNTDAHHLLGDYRFLKSEGTTLSLRKTGRLQQPDLTKELPRSPKSNSEPETKRTLNPPKPASPSGDSGHA